MKNIYFFKDYLKEKYGKALYRIPISLPFSCPNRVQNNGIGCTFCSEDGSAARHLKNNLDLEKQVHKGIEYATERYGATAPYIAYFQAFTNTYAPVATLRKYYSEVLRKADFKMVIISTRSDALPDDVLDYLSELNEQYDLLVELGVQSSNDKTLDRIKRGHDFESVRVAAKKLADRNINCAAHIILGLPGETMEEFKQTARDVAELPFMSIKVHNLLVLKNTPLAKEYANKEFQTLNEYEYAAALIEVLKIIPEKWVVLRITADAGTDEIIAPKWWMKKGQFISYIQDALAKGAGSENFEQFSTIPKIKTEDGSYTFYHPEYKQHFHTLAGAETEAKQKFVDPSKLDKLIKKQDVNLLDVGFGLGYNAISAAKCAIESRSNKLTITTLEKDLKTLIMGLELFDKGSIENEIIHSLIENSIWHHEFCTIKLLIGDAREGAKLLSNNNDKLDIVFLDGFSPDKNPELWSYDFFREICKSIHDKTILVTYSSAFPVRAALIRNKLIVGETKAYGRKRGGTIASKTESFIEQPLQNKDLNIILKSTAGVSYRDPGLKSKSKKMIHKRDLLVKRLRKLGIPKWFK